MFDQRNVFDQLKEIFDEGTALRLTQVFASVFAPVEAMARHEARLDSIDRALGRLVTIGERTDKRLEELAAAQARTEEAVAGLSARFDTLAAAQARTEEVVAGLGIEAKRMRQEIGGLSHTIGYHLENRAYVSLPHILEERFNIVPHEPLYRRFVTDKDGNPMEVNIYGAARRDEETIRIVGEAKSQLSKNAVDEFLRKRIGRLPDSGGTFFPLLIAHMISEPDVEEYARDRGVVLFYSYEL